jgi:hypothetical protein
VAGYREFQTGEVLSAANVNDFLMNQSVMVFADATARTSALSGVVAEGMLTYNKDTAQLEVYDGSAFVLAAPAPPAGIGSNVGQGLLTEAFSSSSASFTDVTSLEVTITPSSATSKVLLIANVNYTNDGAGGSARSTSFRFLRGATAIGIGDASSSRTQASFGSPQEETGSNNVAPNGAMTFLDSPATTDATTYKLQVRVNSGVVRVNVYQTDFTDARSLALISSLTAIEVAV